MPADPLTGHRPANGIDVPAQRPWEPWAFLPCWRYSTVAAVDRATGQRGGTERQPQSCMITLGTGTASSSSARLSTTVQPVTKFWTSSRGARIRMGAGCPGTREKSDAGERDPLARQQDPSAPVTASPHRPQPPGRGAAPSHGAAWWSTRRRPDRPAQHIERLTLTRGQQHTEAARWSQIAVGVAQQPDATILPGQRFDDGNRVVG